MNAQTPLGAKTIDAYQNKLAMKPTEASNAGMPDLDESAGKTSFFEFWPFWAFYTPIILYILWLGIRYRGPTLMTASNPAIPMSGFVGESKVDVLDAVKGDARRWISPYTGVDRVEHDSETLSAALSAMAANDLAFPIVAKPDLGMRGVGVQVAKSPDDLKAYIAGYPVGARFVLQKLVDAEGEVGVFYVRMPGEKRGTVTGLTLKYFPKVVGDGDTTLGDLVAKEPRAGQLAHIYQERHKNRWNSVIPKDETVRLAFAGSHSRGCIFRNGNAYITDALARRMDEIADAMGEFYVGRLDLRFADFDALLAGNGFRIIEINGAGGENTHIWDSRTTLFQAWRVLFRQYRYLWQIGQKNRRRGFKPASVWALRDAWLTELRLTRHYPHTH